MNQSFASLTHTNTAMRSSILQMNQYKALTHSNTA